MARAQAAPEAAGDFRLPVVLFFGSCAVLGITPFAVLRFIQGEWLIGFVDSGMVIALACMMLYAWRTGNTERAGTVLALTNTVGCIVIMLLLGRYGLYWSYMVLLANFTLLSNRALAVLCSLALLLTAASLPQIFDSTPERLSYLTTAAMVGLCAMIFVARSETHQLRLAHLARRDPLTGAGNRRLMEEELDLLMAGALGPLDQAALAVVDIDHFKRINDRYGHEAGDVVIRDLADLLRDRVRKRDRLYRMGGEEFLLLLDGIDADSLYPALDKLRSAVETRLDAPGGRITVSIGAARHMPGEDWRSWLSRADAAMYQAKQAGRNRVCVHAGGGNGTTLAGTDRRREVAGQG